MTNLKVVVLLFLLVLLAGCRSPEEHRRAADEEVYALVDARRKKDYDQGHIPTAICISPYTNIDEKISALIELGAGFHPEISGRENIYINGAVLGLSRKEIDRRYDDFDLTRGQRLWIADDQTRFAADEIGVSPRIGISTAQDLPLRFFLDGSRHVSGPRRLHTRRD